MKILDITKFYSLQSGGVKTYLHAKMEDFANRGIEHTLVVPAARSGVRQIAHTTVFEVRGPIIPFSPNYRLLLAARKIDEIVAATRPDVIEVGSPFIVPHLVRRVARARAIPVIGFYHSDLIRTYAEPLTQHRLAAPLRVATRNFARGYITRTYRRFDAVCAAAPRVVAELRQLGVERVAYVPLGVDLRQFRPRPETRAQVRGTIGVPHDRMVAVFAGRFEREKRLDVILRAHARLPAARRPHLLLIGQGSRQAELEAYARSAGDVTILPFQTDRERLAALLSAADVYLGCGPGETFGLAIAEALACGLPILAVDSGAAADHVDDGRCGWLYEHGSSTSCEAALEKAVTHVTPEMRQAARAYAEREFSWKRTFDRMIEVYRRVAACAAP